MSTALPRDMAIRQIRPQSLFRSPQAQSNGQYICRRCLHASSPLRTRLRRDMWTWLNTQGQRFRTARKGSPNYLGVYYQNGREIQSVQMSEREGPIRDIGAPRQVFPANDKFKSQPVLSEELRDKIYNAVVKDETDIATASAEFAVDMRRIAAVVRLKTIENAWADKGKELAIPYADAVMSMLPQTEWKPEKLRRHESINDLPVHPATGQQIFYPTSESRQFTRVDAANVFDPHLLPADDRIPHPELVQAEKDILAGMTRQERIAAIQAKDESRRKRVAAEEKRKRDWEAKNIKQVSGRRWDFKFENISVDAVGKQGRGAAGVGWRYGVPHQDRKRGQIKIATSVQ